MEMKFNPERIKHVPGQNARIGDPDKAHEMAARANLMMKVAQGYKEYLRKPSQSDHDSALYERMKSHDLEPEYLETLADLAAESTGATYDYKAKMSDALTNELIGDLKEFADEMLAYQNKHPYMHAEKHGDEMNFGMRPTPMGKYVLETDPNEFQRMDRLLMKFKTVGEELKRRKDLGANI